MRLFFDAEFDEDGIVIVPLSIGVVREDGAEYYAEVFPPKQLDLNDWVTANVVPHLTGPQAQKPVHEVAADLIEFAGPEPEWWAYYADYDWVLLCQLYGRMIDLPEGWPMFCMDLKQLAVSKGNPQLPEQATTEHHALADARWVRDSWLWLQEQGPL